MISAKQCKYEFCRLQMNEDGKSALLLGYRIRLTATEYKLLSILLEADGAVGKADIKAALGVAMSSIPVHVVNINKKAYPITRRRLVVSDSGGYRINEHM